MNERVAEIADQLLSLKLTLATAESCTGGWLGQELTALPGSSGWYNGGIISYSNGVKRDLLHVTEHDLNRWGAVSEPVARAMALGVQQCIHSNVSVSITGVAGPGGGTATKPVGTVWMAWRLNQQEATRHFLFSGDREQVRQQTVEAALSGILAILRQP